MLINVQMFWILDLCVSLDMDLKKDIRLADFYVPKNIYI